jgi:hypothetical protein
LEASSKRSPKPVFELDRPPGGGEIKGKLALGAFGGGSSCGASGEGGAGHRLPLTAEFIRFKVIEWSKDARLI